MIVDCKTIAGALRDELQKKIAASGKTPVLAIFKTTTGNDVRDAQTESFLKQKRACGKEIGIVVREYSLDHYMQTQKSLEDYVQGVVHGSNTDIDAAIVQLPLPPFLKSGKKMNIQAVLDKISLEEDADVLNYKSSGRFEAGREGALVPPNVAAIQEVLERHAPDMLDLTKKTVVIVGKGHVVGLQVERWIMRFKTIAISILDKGSDVAYFTRGADFIVSCVGSAGLIQEDMVKDAVVAIDFGYSRKDGVMQGDIHPSVAARARLITPVPGGVGPIAVVKLFENVARICGIKLE